MKTKLLLIHLLIPFLALTQITQIGADIDGEAEMDFSGHVSINADGSIVAIGAQGNDGNGSFSGHVRVYQNIGGAWVQLGTDIDGEAAEDNSGGSVSLSADGSIVAIGAAANDGNGYLSGQVRVYEYSGSWIQVGEDIDGEAELDWSGWEVSLSADGSTVAIGASGNDGNGQDSGHVRVYQNLGGTWTQIGDDIDGEAEMDLSGIGLSLSADGSIVAIGARGNDGNGIDSGHVRVYQYTGSTWLQIGADIDGEAEMDESGFSISLSADGSVVAIGAGGNDGNGPESGHVRVYQNADGVWSQIGADIDGENLFDHSGDAVNLNSDGSVLAIGANWNDGNGSDSGHVRIYKNVGGNWIKIGPDIDGEAQNDYSGDSVSLSADGSIVAIGAPGNDGNGLDSGHVRVYDLSSVLGLVNNSHSNFSIYPSPTSGLLNIISEFPVTQIAVYNLLGQLVLSNSSQNTIDISGLSQGLYFIKIKDKHGNRETQQVVKK